MVMLPEYRVVLLVIHRNLRSLVVVFLVLGRILVFMETHLEMVRL